MAYEDAMAALRLDMPDRVPRTEYSAEGHWPLVRAVTGIDVAPDSPAVLQAKAAAAFRKAWDYGFIWNVLVTGSVFGAHRTTMGHAVYADGGVDFDTGVRALYDDPEEAFRWDPFALYPLPSRSGIARAFSDHLAAANEANPGILNMTGTYVTCLSGLIDIFGWQTLLEMAGTDEDRFGDLATRYADWFLHYFEGLADSDAPVVMVHDDIVWTEGAFLPPAWYRRYLFPAYKRYFAPLREAGKIILYTSDGNYTEFIHDIADCGVHGFVMEPVTDMALVAEHYGRTHAFVGNADTRILLSGTREEIEAEVRRCMDIGKACPGFFMAVGNHIPSNTPVENALWYNECFERMRRR